MAWNQFIGITILLFALTDPMGAIPVFLLMTRQAGSLNRHHIIILACTAVAIVFVGAAFFGKPILTSSMWASTTFALQVDYLRWLSRSRCSKPSMENSSNRLAE